jgi:hypothetical protein
MYYNDHRPPHFHAAYAEHEALFVIDTLEILNGALPRRPLAFVAGWRDEDARVPVRLTKYVEPDRHGKSLPLTRYPEQLSERSSGARRPAWVRRRSGMRQRPMPGS